MLRILPLSLLFACNVITDDLKNTVCNRDGDGSLRADDYCGGNDCDDDDASVGTPETWYADSDSDGWGGSISETACPAAMPGGYIPFNGDCDDNDASINPNIEEVACDGVDNDCDGDTDEAQEPIWYADSDEDGYGDPNELEYACDQPTGYVSDSTDCDDSNASINPEAEETCGDDIDNDCNGIVDDADGSILWYADEDEDSYGNPDNVIAVCDTSEPEGYVSDNTDCDDTDASINPAATEICDNGVDENCNGVVDDDAVTSTWYADADSDSYGDPTTTVEDCAPPEGYVGNDEDCNDSDGAINPAATEVCFTGVDENCNDDADDCLLTGTISLADANSRLLGTQTDTLSGITLKTADLDSDGSTDYLVGAPEHDAGELYVIYGPLSSGDMNLNDADHIITGTSSGDRNGLAVASGDIDDDGIPDVVLGAPGADEVYGLLGPLSDFASTISPTDADLTLTGESSGDYAGVALSICSMDGDGDDELITGAYQNADAGTNAGAVYVHRGPTNEDEELAWANQIFEGSSSSERLGAALDCGDVDGDGRGDLLMGGYEANSGTGVAYLVYGSTGASGTVAIDDYANLTLTGEASGDYGGWDVAYLGDVDGTGNASFAVSAYKEDTGGTDAGAVYLFLSATGSDLGDADVKFTGENAGDYAGYDIAGNCDVDNDGYNDLLIGAFGNDDAGTDAGAAYLIYGASTLSSTISLTDADAKFTGENAGDKAGVAVHCITDSDDYDDMLIGAPYYDSGTATDAGATYLFHGTNW